MKQPSTDWVKSEFRKDWVSVIIPAFNREHLLPETIKSVFDQSYRPIECIVVNDGSTDGTEQVVKQLRAGLEDSSFCFGYIKQDNLGAPAARNSGTQESSGEYIQYLDSDDLIYPRKLEVQVAYLARNENCDGVFGDWDHGSPKEHLLIKAEKSSNLLAQFYGGRVIHTLSFLYRRGIVKKIGPWDTELRRNQEVDFNLRGVLAGGSFDYFPQTTGLWREHGGERIITQNRPGSALQFHDKWIKEFQTRNLFTEELRHISANHLFWKSLEIDSSNKHRVLNYLYKVQELNPRFPEFSTRKMRFLRKWAGPKRSVELWYLWHLRNQKKRAHRVARDRPQKSARSGR